MSLAYKYSKSAPPRFKHSNLHSISTYFRHCVLGSSKTFFREKNLVGQPFHRGGQKCNKSDDKVTLFFNGVMPHKGVKLHGLVGPYKDHDNNTGAGKGGTYKRGPYLAIFRTTKTNTFLQMNDQSLGLLF